jgi:hypothetical protein
MQVRPINEGQEKFRTRAANASEDYKRGVQGAGGRWLEGAAGSASSWSSGTQEAISQGRFEKGVRAAGAAKYQERATTLGPERFRSGVAAGAPEWAKNFAPFHSALSSQQLGTKGPRGSDQNYARAAEVGRLMRRVRNERLGG